MLPEEEWQRRFAEIFQKDPHVPQPEAVMMVILQSFHLDDSTTLQEFVERMKFVRAALNNSPLASVAVMTAGEIFTRFITRAQTVIEDSKTFDEVRQILISRGDDLLTTMKTLPSTISKQYAAMEAFQTVIPIVVTNSRNQCVFQVLKDASARGHLCAVYVTEGQPECYGRGMVQELRAHGVRAEVVLDAAAAFYVERCNLVMVGAEVVCINGGIIARLGTATLTALASKFVKHTYVLAESYRLTEHHTPLNNRNLTIQQQYGPGMKSAPMDRSPTVDYTPPEHIDRLITDVGPIQAPVIEDVINALFI